MIVEHEHGGSDMVGPPGRKLPHKRWFNAEYLAARNEIAYAEVYELVRRGVIVCWEGEVSGRVTKNASVAVVDDEAFAAYLAERRLTRRSFGDKVAEALPALRSMRPRR